jgi:hypothetical protein
MITKFRLALARWLCPVGWHLHRTVAHPKRAARVAPVHRLSATASSVSIFDGERVIRQVAP